MLSLVGSALRYVWDRTWATFLNGLVVGLVLIAFYKLGIVDKTTFLLLYGIVIGWVLSRWNLAVDEWQGRQR